MKVGDYVRTNNGDIGKIIKCPFKSMYLDEIWGDIGNFETIITNNVYKTSPNIIDLIEVGDYVNGECVYSRCETKLWLDGDTGEILIIDGEPDEPIKSIVTKEQFENMEYKIGD